MGCQMLWLHLALTMMAAATSIVQGCDPGDLKGLASFRGGIHMDTSGRLAKWAGHSCCRWQGVACNNRTGRVTEVHLPGFISTTDFVFQSQMEGWLSPSITLLASLEVLDLGGLVGLSGRIPTSIGRLKNLKKLYLYGNKLRGPVPDSIGKLLKLEELHLHENRLSGYLPPGIGFLKNLHALLLHSNRFTGSIPASFSNLTNLMHLDKLWPNANAWLQGAIPSSLGDLQGLTELYLGGNELSGVVPKSIGRLSRLILLSLSCNSIQGPLPDEMSALQNLQTLDLSFNSLNLSSIPSPIQELDLSSNYLTDGIPAWMGSLTQLYSLNLSRNHLSSSFPASVADLEVLEVLDLHSNNLTGSLEHVFKIETSFPGGSLTYIDQSDNSFTSTIEQIGVGTLERLEYLNLSHNLQEGRLPTSVEKLKALKCLDLSFNKLGFGLVEALANLSHLKTLKLQRNRFTGKIPVEFLNLKNLKDLDLSDNLLVGEIPSGKPLSDFPQSCFTGNRGLCGKPLSPCKS
ncbi:CW14 protein isoform 1 [Hibiscus syriacus]|uniref:CW14 protein isoform 1 n=1 Tax=Hibiscus syriacus TaxID=106335 RepID=A0A6A3CLK3_HIBSY|nr:CW14 protein isoform 1 [Hibiscus syriacus]